MGARAVEQADAHATKAKREDPTATVKESAKKKT